jgi:hypothetical protein
MTSKTAKAEAKHRSAMHRILTARLQGIEALRELLLTDEEARNHVMPVKPGDDLEVAVNDFIMGVRQESDRQAREEGVTVDDYAGKMKKGLKAASKKADKLWKVMRPR